MENMFDIFKPRRFKATHHTPDFSSKFSTMTPKFSATKDPHMQKEPHIQRSLPSWLNPLNGENETSLVQKIAARFVPQENFHSSQNHDVPDGRETPLSRGGNPVKQRQLFRVSGDKPISEGFISKINVDHLMSYKSATKPKGKQTTMKTPDLSNNSAEVKTVEGQLETREELSEKRKTTRGKGEESMKEWAEFTRKGEEFGKGDQPVLGLLVLVWLINQREILKDLVELRNNSIHGQKILHSNQDVANTNLMTLTQQISSLQECLEKQQQQVHTQMTHLRRLMLLCCLSQLMLLVSMATWTNPGVRGRLQNWYRYIMVTISRPAVSLLTTLRDASQHFLHRFTSKFTQMIYSWPRR